MRNLGFVSFAIRYIRYKIRCRDRPAALKYPGIAIALLAMPLATKAFGGRLQRSNLQKLSKQTLRHKHKIRRRFEIQQQHRAGAIAQIPSLML